MIAHLDIWTVWLFVYAGLPLAWASVVLHARTPWRASEMGRHLFAYAVVIATIMTFVGVRWWFFHRTVFPDWLQIVQFFTYLALIAVMAWRVWLQVRAARTHGGDDAEV